jgi:small subunit ribosomal protein S12
MPTYNQYIKKGRIKKVRYSRIKALGGCPQKKGSCMKIYTTSPKKPNSANRRVAKVKLSNDRKIIAYIPNKGSKLQKHSTVLIKSGRTRDLPGLKFKMIRGKYDFEGLDYKRQGRSKVGTKKKI